VSLLLAGIASTLDDDGKSLFLWGDEVENIVKCLFYKQFKNE